MATLQGFGNPGPQ